MPIIATRNKSVLSSVVADDVNALVHDYNYAHGQTAEEASDAEYTLGQVVYWDTDHWEIAKTGDFTSNVLNASNSTADTAGNSLGVVVGFDSLGDSSTATVGSAGRNVVVLYQGAVNVKESGLVFDSGLSAAQEANAKAVLASQGIKLVDTAAKATVSFYGA